MAALYLHNSIWIPDTTSASPPRARTLSTSAIHSVVPSHLDLPARQPEYCNSVRSQMGLSFDGDPTATRELKGYLEKVVRKRLGRLKTVVRVLEVIMFVWALYTTIRYLLALALALQAHILGPAHTNPTLTWTRTVLRHTAASSSFWQ
ncbi:hypothetical protein K438DRAFT_1955774 [Mycena galopus ATCC 62051]|nr:hypothetical protein K438DRAFT_1955774 [Mycena galopus ATCC 62051]